MSTLGTAATSLLRNRLRTGLTVLGIGIGVAAVMCTAALGAAGTTRIQQQMDAVGQNFLWIRAGSRSLGGVRTGFGGARTLTPDDARAIASGAPGITACSPQLSGRQQIVAGGRNWNTRYQGVWPDYFAIRNRYTVDGAPFTDTDEANAARVLVLGSRVASELFPDGGSVGATVRMNGFPFQIIGVLDPRGAAAGGLDRDDTVMLPLAAANRFLTRQTWVTDVMCSVATPDAMSAAEDAAAALLRIRHHLTGGTADDFQIQRPEAFLETRARAARALALMLTAVGGVSLVVGGVGIMNIMLVSVTERRQEIGVRLAVGARVRDIRWQFLVEAAMLGLSGGLAGIALGWAGTEILSNGFAWPAILSPEVTLLATACAMGAGLLFGYLPARRASRLDPIDAIRLDA